MCVLILRSKLSKAFFAKVVFSANRRKNNPDFVGLSDEIYKAASGLCDILFLFRMNV